MTDRNITGMNTEARGLVDRLEWSARRDPDDSYLVAELLGDLARHAAAAAKRVEAMEGQGYEPPEFPTYAGADGREHGEYWR